MKLATSKKSNYRGMVEKVNLIIGTEEPKLWAVLASRFGRGRKDPVAQLGPLGWMLIGSRVVNEKAAAFIQRDFSQVHDDMRRLYSMEFSDINPDKIGQSRDNLKALEVWSESCKMVEHQGQMKYELALCTG